MDNEKLQTFPKIDLHCHLDGSLPVAYVKSILGDYLTEDDLQVRDDCRNLAEYLEKFDLPLQTMQTEDGLREGALSFIEEIAKETIAYVEVRFAPLLSVHSGLSTKHVIEAVLRGLKEGSKRYGVECNVIVCAMRHHSEEENITMIKTARDFLGEGVCAADLAGNEAAYPMNQFKNVFQEAKNLGMPFTIHAGECGSVDNIKEAIKLGAARIGHGIAMRNHPELQRLCAEKHIGVEMCPISNLQTKAIERISDYPIKEFMEHEVLVTVNTDNRTVSNTSITKELQWVQKNCHLTDEDCMKLMRNAVEVSFASDDVKHRLVQLYR